MKISRRDTAIIAVLVNVALLAVLFATGDRQEKEKGKALHIQEKSESANGSQLAQEILPIANDVTSAAPVNSEPLPLTLYTQTEEKNPVDEIDRVLQEYALKQKVITVPVANDESESVDVAERDVDANDYYVVTVKKGDALEKIARAHGTKVEELMKLNALESIKLRIGQKLKVPHSKVAKSEQEMPVCIAKETKQLKEIAKEAKVKAKKDLKNPVIGDGEYYVIQSGDSPWKVAKKFHLKYEDLLILNDLDEEKARNLKIGQKIRIR